MDKRLSQGTPINELIKYGTENKEYMKGITFNNSDLKFYNPPDKDEMIKKGISGIIL